MNIVFFGNPEFAAKSLEYLNNFNDINILAVVTNSDKKMGRGRKVCPTPVKIVAKKYLNKVIEVDDLNSFNTKNALKDLDADLFIVIAYKILPKTIYIIPKFGSINLHPSLLPKYQGSSPIQYTLLNGDKKTGLTSFFINDKIDQGDIIYQQEISINDTIEFIDLFNKFILISKEVLRISIDIISAGNRKYITQNKISKNFRAPKIKKTDFIIKWYKSSFEIHNQIRALSYKGAYTYYKNKRIKLYSSKYNSKINEYLSPGEATYTNSKLSIGTGCGILYIKEVQLEGAKRIKVDDFINSIKIDKFNFSDTQL